MIHQAPELADRVRVFADRADAGRQLALLLSAYRGTDALVLAVPAGGVPVAAEVARALNLPLDVAVVSKVTLPWNSEVGCGAVAFDGSAEVDRDFAEAVGLFDDALQSAVAHARQKVGRRLLLFREGRPAERLPGRTVLLVDDGVASGSTLKLATSALRRAGAARVVIAVPTGHATALASLAEIADEIYSANVRTGPRFAVADAYQRWYDEEEGAAARLVALVAGERALALEASASAVRA